MEGRFHRRSHQNSRVVPLRSFNLVLFFFLSVRLTFYLSLATLTLSFPFPAGPPLPCPPLCRSPFLPLSLPPSVSSNPPVCGFGILSVTAAKYANEVANIWLIPYLSPAVKHAVSHSPGKRIHLSLSPSAPPIPLHPSRAGCIAQR